MKSDIVECLKLIRLLRRIFGTTDPDHLNPDERRVIGEAARSIQGVISPFLSEDANVH